MAERVLIPLSQARCFELWKEPLTDIRSKFEIANKHHDSLAGVVWECAFELFADNVDVAPRREYARGEGNFAEVPKSSGAFTQLKILRARLRAAENALLHPEIDAKLRAAAYRIGEQTDLNLEIASELDGLETRLHRLEQLIDEATSANAPPLKNVHKRQSEQLRPVMSILARFWEQDLGRDPRVVVFLNGKEDQLEDLADFPHFCGSVFELLNEKFSPRNLKAAVEALDKTPAKIADDLSVKNLI